MSTVHFEFHVRDTGRARAFYTAVPPTDFEGIGRVACAEVGAGNIFGLIAPPQARGQ